MRALYFASVALVVLSSTACLGSESTKHANGLSVTVENGYGQVTYKLSCDPPSGDTPSPGALCRTITSNTRVMLHEKKPSQPCFGGLGTIHLHVAGLWEGKSIDADVDACSGNVAGEKLWMSQLVQPRTFSVDLPAFAGRY